MFIFCLAFSVKSKKNYGGYTVHLVGAVKFSSVEFTRCE